MTYSYKGKIIAIDRLLGLGKRPSLLIGESNKYCSQIVKVASFSSDEKADLFEEYLRFFFGDSLKKDE